MPAQAAKRGTNRVSVVNEILTEFLKAAGKLGVLAFLACHRYHSPADWSRAALITTGKTALATVRGFVSSL